MNRPRLLMASMTLAHFVLSGSAADAQPTVDDPAEPDSEVWNQVLLEAKLDTVFTGLRLSLDTQVRRMNAPLNAGVENPNTVLILRPGIGYQFNDWGTVTLGHAFQPDYCDDPSQRAARNIAEHRIWERLSGKWTFTRTELGLRTRLDQRVRTNGPGGAENDGGLTHWAHRYRQQVRFAYTFRDGEPWQLIVSDEFFVRHDSNYRTRTGWDQNRAFVGIGYNAPSLRVEVGYLNQYVHGYTDPFQLNHVFARNFAVKLGRRGGSHPAPAETAPSPMDLAAQTVDVPEASQGADGSAEPDPAVPASTDASR